MSPPYHPSFPAFLSPSLCLSLSLCWRHSKNLVASQDYISFGIMWPKISSGPSVRPFLLSPALYHTFLRFATSSTRRHWPLPPYKNARAPFLAEGAAFVRETPYSQFSVITKRQYRALLKVPKYTPVLILLGISTSSTMPFKSPNF